jgi:ABC-type branched-subunit amino acid transport system substrate-binding protein
MPSSIRVSRRGALALGAAAAASVALPTWAQPGKAAGRVPTIIQFFDVSAAQQDVAKDFVIGSRAAWQDINAKGGVRGRAVQHTTVEVDGTAALKAALEQALDNPACVVLSGTAGDPLATETVRLLREQKATLAHAAPWLQNSSLEVDDRTFPIFAARQEQIEHALKSLSVMGMSDLGAVYATPEDERRHREDLERVAAALKIRLLGFRGDGDLVRLGQKLGPQTPAVLLFLGGSPELVQLTQGLEKQARQRYVVALADVNLQTVMQMGGARSTPVIATTPVPVVTASLPVVRQYRETLARLFDEPPTPQSLAGFIAARYTYEVLNDVDGAVTREKVLAAFQRRASLDVGGYRIAFDNRRRSATFVTQSMLTVDGRVIG